MFKIPSARSLLIVVCFFISSSVIGFLKAPDFTGQETPILGRPIVNLRNTTPVRQEVSMELRHGKFRRFMLHNSRVELATLLVGTLCFVFPAAKVSVFGFIIGVLSWHLGSVELFMKLMLPHSLTEIPTVLYCCAVAQSSGWKWLIAGRGNRWKCLKGELVSNSKMWVLVIIPAVIVNALLEAYVTNR